MGRADPRDASIQQLEKKHIIGDDVLLGEEGGERLNRYGFDPDPPPPERFIAELLEAAEDSIVRGLLEEGENH